MFKHYWSPQLNLHPEIQFGQPIVEEILHTPENHLNRPSESSIDVNPFQGQYGSMELEYNDSFACENNRRLTENYKDSQIESPSNCKISAREHKRLMLLSQVDELILKLAKREEHIENLKFVATEKAKSFNFKSDINKDGFIVNLTALKEKSAKNSKEEFTFFLDEKQLRRIFKCPKCGQLFEKACSLGGHISRSHYSEANKSIYQIQDIQKDVSLKENLVLKIKTRQKPDSSCQVSQKIPPLSNQPQQKTKKDSKKDTEYLPTKVKKSIKRIR